MPLTACGVDTNSSKKSDFQVNNNLTFTLIDQGIEMLKEYAQELRQRGNDSAAAAAEVSADAMLKAGAAMAAAHADRGNSVDEAQVIRAGRTFAVATDYVGGKVSSMTFTPGRLNALMAGLLAGQSVSAAFQADAALQDVVIERLRQMQVKGWSIDSDDTRVRGELADAAAAYATTSQMLANAVWPFNGLAGNWVGDQHPERRQMLVKATALLVAEIQRRDRAAARLQCPTEYLHAA